MLTKDRHVEPRETPESIPPPPTPEARVLAFWSLVASLPEAPAVPLEALDRESLYP